MFFVTSAGSGPEFCNQRSTNVTTDHNSMQTSRAMPTLYHYVLLAAATPEFLAVTTFALQLQGNSPRNLRFAAPAQRYFW